MIFFYNSYIECLKAICSHILLSYSGGYVARVFLLPFKPYNEPSGVVQGIPYRTGNVERLFGLWKYRFPELSYGFKL
jgi:hypothetical protein